MQFNRMMLAAALALAATTGLLFSQQEKQVQKGKGGGKGLIRSLDDVTKDLKGTLQRVKVHGKSLEGNLEGYSPDRDVFIYLPPSYATETGRRYPVVYLLHGYGLNAERWMGFLNLASIEKNFAAGTAKEMMVVSPDAFTQWNGSMYSSSATTGDWEGYLSGDLVSYVDGNYRTIADRGARGLSGHSMGGYGTMRVGMKHPEVFSGLYALSSCCLGANLSPNVQQMAALEAFQTPEEAKAKGGNMATLASAAAWSPNANNPPFYFDLPVKGGEVQPKVVARWAANAPLAMLDQNAANLKKYKAIALDCGLQDGLIASNRELDALLSQAGVTHTFETYEGDHNSKVAERFDTKVWAFFSRNLSFEAARR